MSYDFTMLRRSEARQDGHDPRFRMNNTAMSLIRQLLDQQGVLDWDESGPLRRPAPASGDWQNEEEAYDAAFTLWHAEQRARVQAKGVDELKIPAVKFQSNDGWEVFAPEATRIADALREPTKEAARTAIERDDEESKEEGVTTAWGEKPVEDLLRIAQAFADFNGLSSRYGGYRVF